MEFLLNFVAICLLINQGYGINSHLSSINTEGRPILRSEIDVLDASKSPEVTEDVSNWLGDLRARIERLVSRHGYEYAKPFIKDAVDATEKKQSVLLDVKGESKINYQYKNIMRMRANSGEAQKGPEPEWMVNFKYYVRYLISMYGIDQDKLEPHISPVVHSLEAKHNIDIITIDGDLNVHYKDMAPVSSLMVLTPAPPKRSRGYRNKYKHRSSYSNGRGVTQIYES